LEEDFVDVLLFGMDDFYNYGLNVHGVINTERGDESVLPF
jgi:hypothetical protein